MMPIERAAAQPEPLPAITAIDRWTIKPGDRLIIHTDAYELSQQDAGWVQQKVRAVLGLPGDFPVMVLAKGWRVAIAGDGEPQPEGNTP